MLRLAILAATGCALLAQVATAQTSIPVRTYKEELVYRTKQGYQDEFWKLLQRYELAELDAFRKSGEIVDYSVYRPSLHADEGSRWDYRVIVTYRHRGDHGDPRAA